MPCMHGEYAPDTGNTNNFATLNEDFIEALMHYYYV